MPNFVLINQADPTDPNNYALTSVTPTCTGAKNRVCYIVANDDGLNRPIIDCTIIFDIVIALQSKTDSPTIKLKM